MRNVHSNSFLSKNPLPLKIVSKEFKPWLKPHKRNQRADIELITKGDISLLCNTQPVFLTFSTSFLNLIQKIIILNSISLYIHNIIKWKLGQHASQQFFFGFSVSCLKMNFFSSLSVGNFFKLQLQLKPKGKLVLKEREEVKLFSFLNRFYSYKGWVRKMCHCGDRE